LDDVARSEGDVPGQRSWLETKVIVLGDCVNGLKNDGSNRSFRTAMTRKLDTILK